MKILDKILAVAGLCFAVASCTTDLDIAKTSDPSAYKAPEISSPSAIVITADDIANEKTVDFVWTKADFGQKTEVVYGINATYGSKKASLYTNLSGTLSESSVSYSVKVGELADKLKAISVPEGSAASVSFTITATIGSNFEVLESSSKSVSVTIE